MSEKKALLYEYIPRRVIKDIISFLHTSTSKPIYVIDKNAHVIDSVGNLSAYSQHILCKESLKKEYDSRRADIILDLGKIDEKVLFFTSVHGLLELWCGVYVDSRLVGAIGIVDVKSDSCTKIPARVVQDMSFSYNVEALFNDMSVSCPQTVALFGGMLYSSAHLPVCDSFKRQESYVDISLKDLNELITSINSDLDVDRIASLVLPFVLKHTGVCECSLLLFEEGSLVRKYHGGSFVESKVMDDIAKSVSDSKRHLVISSVKNDFRFSRLHSEHGIVSLVAHPLHVRGEVIGSLVLYYRHELQDISDVDMMLATLIEYISYALFHAYTLTHAKKRVSVDDLSGLYNREYFESLLRKELLPNVSHAVPLSVALVDIDNFKQYNDIYGHLKGDELIALISEILRERVSKDVVVGRYGGEEFIVIMPKMSIEDAESSLESIRSEISKLYDGSDKNKPMSKVTVSVGLVTCTDNSVEYERLIETVDAALYKSKTSGKNRVTKTLLLDKHLPDLDLS